MSNIPMTLLIRSNSGKIQTFLNECFKIKHIHCDRTHRHLTTLTSYRHTEPSYKKQDEVETDCC